MDTRRPSDEFVTMAAWCVTLTVSSTAMIVNSFLLAILLLMRLRQSNSSLLIMTFCEVVLTFSLTISLLWTQLVSHSSVLDSTLHTMHATRNMWLVVMAVCRTVVILRPFSTITSGSASSRSSSSGSSSIISLRQQVGALCGIVGVCGGVIFASSWFADAAAGKVDAASRSSAASNAPSAAAAMAAANNTTESMQVSAININATAQDQQESLDHYLAIVAISVRIGLLRYLLLAAFGTVLPGLCVFFLGCLITRELRKQLFHHNACRRSCRAVLLLSLGFVVLEFPFALLQVVTCAYLLASSQPAMSVLTLLEILTNWGIVCVPVDSCLNFVVLLCHSRSFRENLRNGCSMAANRMQPQHQQLLVQSSRSSNPKVCCSNRCGQNRKSSGEIPQSSYRCDA